MNTLFWAIIIITGLLVIGAIWWSETWDAPDDTPDEHAEYPGETRRPE